MPAGKRHTVQSVDHVLWAYLIPTPALVGATAAAAVIELGAELVEPDPAAPGHFLATVPLGSTGATVRAVLPLGGGNTQSVDFVVPALPAGERVVRITTP